jgi:single-strand DNA-binding protein
MAGLNRVQLIGRLGTEPETRNLSGGRSVCSFRMAVDRRWRGSDDTVKSATDWFNVEAWGRLGEICQQYLSKGRLVFLEGRLQAGRYEQNETVQCYTKVTANQIQMLDTRPESEVATEAEADEMIEEPG